MIKNNHPGAFDLSQNINNLYEIIFPIVSDRSIRRSINDPEEVTSRNTCAIAGRLFAGGTILQCRRDDYNAFEREMYRGGPSIPDGTRSDACVCTVTYPRRILPRVHYRSIGRTGSLVSGQKSLEKSTDSIRER